MTSPTIVRDPDSDDRTASGLFDDVRLEWIFDGSIRILVGMRRVEDHVLAYCRDLPGAHAQGANEADALARLRDVVVAAVAVYRDAGEDIPWEDVESEPGDWVGPQIVLDA